MKTLNCALISFLLIQTLAWGQQSNVNLDYNPQKNTENLIPFSAPLNSPDVNSKIDYLFVGQGTVEAEGWIGGRCVALHEALTNHNIEHEYYVGGYGGHDWATWRHLLYYKFLPNLWKNK